ncbi:MAG: hypothetical protein H6595_12765 [Flavobacteriales bacterium]|nr:hypothetical protein [Flavobacteriales bacterium]MCB9168335.1 hypothetical protein [Flavobacteriales bacterium]
MVRTSTPKLFRTLFVAGLAVGLLACHKGNGYDFGNLQGTWKNMDDPCKPTLTIGDDRQGELLSVSQDGGCADMHHAGSLDMKDGRLYVGDWSVEVNEEPFTIETVQLTDPQAWGTEIRNSSKKMVLGGQGYYRLDGF